jgi:anti-sigma B factor antagonist
MNLVCREAPSMSLQLSIRKSAEVTILDLQGRATIGRGNDLLSSQLRKLIADGTANVLLNLAGLTQVDSSSLSTIVRAFVSLGRKSGRLKLLRPRGSVKLVLETLHLLEVIPSYEDEAQAVASFR